MLAWHDAPGQPGLPESWWPAAQDLAARVPVQVVLPHANPRLKHNNMTITGLDTLVLPVSSPAPALPASYPFALSPGPGLGIPLYGTPVYAGPDTGPARRRLPGEAVQAGYLTLPGEVANRTGLPAPTPQAGLQAQVISFARSAVRFAQTQYYTTIYAFHWQTFLAALELKRITGKRLVVRADRFSQTHSLSDNKVWKQELERQALEKADEILVHNDRIAVEPATTYAMAAQKIIIPGQDKQALTRACRGKSDQSTRLKKPLRRPDLVLK